MSDDRIRKLAEAVVYKWKLKIDPTRLPVHINLSMEDKLVDLIEDAMRDVCYNNKG
jgi:hypothetical protein